jgi:hypothetical protein
MDRCHSAYLIVITSIDFSHRCLCGDTVSRLMHRDGITKWHIHLN